MKRSYSVAAAVVGVGLFAWLSFAGEVEKKGETKFDAELPPRVVKTVPEYGDKDVDFALREIKVTYDRPMQTEKAWSWIIHQNLGLYPGYRGGPEPRWEDEGRTCVLAVRLSPDTLYAVGVNSVRHDGFKGADGKVAVPYVCVFKTKKAKP